MGEALDKYITSSRRTFMEMTEMPTVEMDAEGYEISGFSNTYEASHRVLAAMRLEEKLELLREVFEEHVTVIFDAGMVDSGQRTLGQIIDDCLVYGLDDWVTSDHEVNAREQSNMETHSAGFAPRPGTGGDPPED